MKQQQITQRVALAKIVLIIMAILLIASASYAVDAANEKAQKVATDSETVAERGVTPESFAIARESMQNTGAKLASGYERLASWLKPHLGNRLVNPFVVGISPLKFFFFVLMILVVALADLLLKKLIRKRVAAVQTTELPEAKLSDSIQEIAKEADNSQSAFLMAVRKPLSLLLWAYGVFIAIIFLFSAQGAQSQTHWIPEIAGSIAGILGYIAVFWIIFRCISLIEIALEKWASAPESSFEKYFVPLIGHALRVVVPLVAVIIALPVIKLPDEIHDMLQKFVGVTIIVAITWILIELIQTVEVVLLKHFKGAPTGSLRARKIYTQIHIIKKIVLIMLGIFALGSVLMIFDSVRQLGAGIMTSAGIFGIIIGFSAQKTLSLMVAGLQIAITQPIRIDDVVIVENEWGWIEEITLTYVVVRIWDLRRLVLPISYFIEKPFQNWTRVSADIMGTVMLYVDYSIDVEKVRSAVNEMVSASPLWDRKVCGVQITGATDRSMELRVLVSAENSGKAWDLRCEVREKLINFIQTNFPGSLPRIRAEFSPFTAFQNSQTQDNTNAI